MDLLQFYGLNEDPFRLTPDPVFFFPSVVHNEALLSMNYVIQQKEGFCLIIGEPGTGKTTLLNVFKESWKDKAEIALILTPRLSPEEFLLSVLDDLNVKLTRTNKNDILKAFRDFLIEKSITGKPVIIIVDEAQNLPDDTLEELRLLSNLETDKDKLLQIILIGQPELELRLAKDNLRQLNQRITVRIRLNPLSSNETLEYMNYRLIKAGKGFLRLDDRLLNPIYRFSQGIPRIINILSSRAIMSAYLEGSNIITNKHVRYAIRHLKNDVAGKELRNNHRRIYAVILFALLTAGGASAFYFFSAPQTPSPLQADKLTVQQATIQETKKEDNIAAPASTLTQETRSIDQNINQDPVKKGTEKDEEKKKQQRTVIVTATTATIRTKPSLNAERLTWASRGVVLEVVDVFIEDTGKKWHKVKISDGSEAWIADKVVAVKESNE